MSRYSKNKYRRRGAAAALTALSTGLLIGFSALAVDVGMLYNARTELQRSADAAAMAGVSGLVTDARIKGGDAWASALIAARNKASSYGSTNKVFNSNPTVDINSSNQSSGDVLLGRFNNPDNLTEALLFPGDTTTYNSVEVLVRRNAIRNGPIPLCFARIFGKQSSNIEAMAAATIDDRIVGFKIRGNSGNPLLLPFTLRIDAWNNLLAGGAGTSDSYAYAPSNGSVSGGTDGIRELNMYPGAGTEDKKDGDVSGGGQFPQLGPGNFGTVDIGSSGNSTADIARQILEGPNTSDLAHFGGELKLNSSGYVMLNGDTGLSAGVKDELTSIIGKPRVIPIFDQVSGNGNNANYRIIGFGGIRILHVDLNGSMSSKQVIIQPAAVLDATAQTGTNGVPHYVYAPVRLTR